MSIFSNTVQSQFQTVNKNFREVHGLVCGCHAGKCAAMCRMKGDPAHHFVAFGYLIVNGGADIWEGCQKRTRGGKRWVQRQFIEDGEIVFVPHFIEKTADNRFIRF